ncbi:hypothetical protein ES754_00830 [Psychrobacter frigidicola]|uniref:Uncharacterized protein n=1 Tax=Psychrobacter frigidicola TaxID=45611 RepID=A0A5C7A4M6_9GAMM|nr:hypothetical protein [Psychrobacter frigidicola]TXD97564.1 hypothetical protein ES754_00830 [Psychrobacter frigidicola]
MNNVKLKNGLLSTTFGIFILPILFGCTTLKPYQVTPIAERTAIINESPSDSPQRDSNKSLSDIFIYLSTGGQMPGIVSGKFVIKDNCLMLQVAKDKYMTPLFPPDNVAYLEEEKTIVLKKGVKIKLGEKIFTGGVTTPTTNLEFATQGDAACLTEIGMAIDADIMEVSEEIKRKLDTY